MASRPTYFNARTGELKGIQSMTLGTPEVSLQDYIVNEVFIRQEEVYDSDRVVSTILKNFNPAYIAPGAVSFDSDQIVAIINENTSPVVGGGLDSETIMNMANEHGWNYLDSDAVLAAVLKNLNIANVATLTDINDINNNIITINNKIDSESTKVSSLKTRVYGLVKNNDSDHNKSIQSLNSEINRVDNQLDSDHNAYAGFRRFVLGITGIPTADFAYYYSAAGGFGSNPFHDSDLILQTINKGYNPDAAAYDSDLVVGTINKNLDIASLSRVPTNPLDSDEVFNMGTEHGWFYDSDKVIESINKNFQYIINITNNNLGKVDSEFVFTMLDSEEVENMFAEHGLAYQSSLDSESAEIRLLRADVNSLVAGTYNDAPVLARLNDLEASIDSESARINLLFTNADSDVIEIGQLRIDADSDSLVIQSLSEQAALDSAKITLILNDLDSDGIHIQALSTSIEIIEAVNTIQNSRLNTLEARADSEEIRVSSLQTQVNNLVDDTGFDSDQVVAIINENTSAGASGLDSDNVLTLISENAVSITDSDLKAIADLRNDVDSDSIRIQDLQTQINNLVDDTGFDSDQIVAIIGENVTPFDDTNIIARLDSDSIIIQDLQTQINNIDVADLRARLDSDSIIIQAIRTSVDSDYDLFNTKIALFNGLTDSDLTTVSNLRNDIDSDSIRIQDLQTQINNLVDDTGFDSDQVVSIINENVTLYDDSTLIARLDSDETIIQSLQTQIDVLVAGTYDDSAVVARLDSDTTAIQDISSRVTVLEAAVDDTGFDSDQIESMINEHVTPYDDSGIVARLDSDETIIQSLQTQIDVLVAGAYDDSTVIARLDSDELIVQSLQTQIDLLTVRLDSDTTVIQSLQTQLDGFDVADIRARLDSDSIAIQSIRSSVDSDYALFNAKIALFNGLTDSDLTTVSILRNDLDSESFEIRALRSDVDSDSIKIQTMQGQVDALVAGTYDDAPIVARLDSDSIRIQDLQTQINNLVDDTGFDSDQIESMINEHVTPYDDSGIIARLDSDSIKIQIMQGQVNALVAGTYYDAPIIARLDSDSAVLQELKSDLDDSEFIIERTPLRLNNASFATTSSNQVLDTYDANEHKTVKYIISANKGTDWQSSECLVNHDGTTAYITEYSVMDSGAGDLYIPDVDVSGGAVRLLVTPQTTNIVVSIIRTQIN